MSQVIIPQVIYLLSLFIFRGHATHQTCLQQDGLFGRGFGKKCRWVDRKGRNKQGRNGSKCSIDTERDSDTKRDTKIEIATGTDRPTDRQTDKQTFNHWISFSCETDRQTIYAAFWQRHPIPTPLRSKTFTYVHWLRCKQTRQCDVYLCNGFVFPRYDTWLRGWESQDTTAPVWEQVRTDPLNL